MRISAEEEIPDEDEIGACSVGPRARNCYSHVFRANRISCEIAGRAQVLVWKGHGDAAYNLEIICERLAPGLSGPPDHVAAAKYLQIAAGQGIADGQCLLGTLFADGNGVAKDNVAAYEWMTLAAQNGNAGCSQRITPFLPQMTRIRLPKQSVGSRLSAQAASTIQRLRVDFAPVSPRLPSLAADFLVVTDASKKTRRYRLNDEFEAKVANQPGISEPT